MSRLAELVHAFDPTLPLRYAHTIPANWYHDPLIDAAEREAVFATTWQLVGRRALVQQPGNFLTADIAGDPILVLRDELGILRAFHNVCRHRAAPLLTAPCGKVSKLRCRYHGWTYDLSGQLRGMPEFDGVCDFRREDNGLTPIAVAEWGHWVWVHLGQPSDSLEAYLSPLPQWAIETDLNQQQFVATKEYRLKCNWKVFVDNYLDGGYHVNTVHPSLAGVLDYASYRTTLYDWVNVQTSPLKQDTAPDDQGLANRTRTGTEAAYWWIFPNVMVNHYAGVMDLNLVWPIGPEECRVIFEFYFLRVEGNESFIAESMAVAERVQQEDISICEEVQRGLKSRSFSTGRFSVKRENGGYHFHQLLARRLQKWEAEQSV